MIPPDLLRRYRARRGTIGLVGHDAQLALRYARESILWDELEARELVRFRAIPDDDPDLSYLDEWTGTREGRAGAKHVRELYEREGACIVFAEYRTDPLGEWRTAESIGGFLGFDDFKGSGYDADMIGATLRAYQDDICEGL